jgi:transposase, IS5 family
LIVDATCAPADISYPTDLGLLNKARVHTEKITDILYKQIKEKVHKKPRTYRNLARKDYLAVAKQRRPTKNKRRQAIKKQLQYIKRNSAHIEQLIELGASLEGLTKKQYKTLLVLTEVTRQQQWLFDNDKQSIEDRIVSLSQPHIRPIVRGKAGKSVERRAKLSEGIRLSGPPLGRPPANVSKSKKKQALEDERIRNAICQKVWARQTKIRSESL